MKLTIATPRKLTIATPRKLTKMEHKNDELNPGDLFRDGGRWLIIISETHFVMNWGEGWNTYLLRAHDRKNIIRWKRMA